MTGEELRKAGERMSNLARLFNIREGLTRKDDATVPDRIRKDPIPSGAGKGSVLSQEDLDILLDGYYDARGWTKAGVPKIEKLEELGLSAYADIALKANESR